MRKIIFLMVLFLLCSFGIGVLSQDIELPDPGLTPDSPFYFLDTLGEKIRMFFAFGAEKKAEKAMQYAEEKLAEVEAMAEKNKIKALEKANKKYEEYLDLANEKVKKAREKGRDVEKLATLITEKTLKHQEMLVRVFEKVPEEAKEAIQKAIEVSREGSETAVQAVSGEKKEELQQTIEEVKARTEKKIEVEISCKDSLDCPTQMKCENSICTGIGCIKEGEMGPSAGINPEWLDHLPTECCEGLKSITYSGYFDENCNFKPLVGAPTGVCSKCGNGVCEEWETKCNCPEDCKITVEEEEKEIICIGKGGETWAGDPNCCPGLDVVSDCLPDEPCPISLRYCVDCGNGLCEAHENWYNCPEDCKKEEVCVDKCGDGVCNEAVCLGTGCPCAETEASCPEDCFLLETPVLTDPGVSVNKHEPFTLNWTSVSGAKWYGLQYSTSTNFSIAPPPWICEVNSDTDNPGVGTSSPEVTTTYYYRVKACDDHGCGSYSNVVDMQVIVPPSITVTSPNGGERWVIGDAYDITWTSPGVDSAAISVCFVSVTGRQCTHLIGVHSGAGIMSWPWPIDPNTPYVPGDNLKIKITAFSDSTIYDESDNYFSIVEPATCTQEENGVRCEDYFYEDYCSWTPDGIYYTNIRKCNASEGSNCGSLVGADRILCPYGCQTGACLPGITVTSPNGGESWGVGKTYSIQWTSGNLPTGSNIDIELIGVTETGNTVRKTLFSSLPNNSTNINWLVPTDIKGRYRIRVISYAFICGGNQSTCLDDSDAPFSIVNDSMY